MKAETEGIGIGLSTANALIRALGGGIRSKSEVDGSFFKTEIWFTTIMTSINCVDNYQ